MHRFLKDLINLQRLITYTAVDYKTTIEYLYEMLPVFHRIGPAAYKANLDNTLKLAELYGNPQRKFKSIHIAGTNGKGSVSHMIASVFQSAGYKTGLYTSPHLKDFRERIKINGKMIPKKEVIKWVKKYVINNKEWKTEPSFFELTVILAFDYFVQNAVDVAIIETGLGGRLDSTNIISPELSVITNIGFDHTALLGNTLEKIATEKAGIIKKDVPVVIGRFQDVISHVFAEKAQSLQSEIYFAGNELRVIHSETDLNGYQVFEIQKENTTIFPGLKTDLKGIYQKENVCTVLKSLEILRQKGWNLPDKCIYEGISEAASQTGLMGRWQILCQKPLIICDTGHNSDGIMQVVNQLKTINYHNLHFIFGMVNDKESDHVLKLLPPEARFYFTKASIPRALDEKLLFEKAKGFGLNGKPYPTVKEALKDAKRNAGPNDLIFIGGSTFIVAEIL